MLKIFSEYLSNRSVTVTADGQSCRIVDVISGVLQGNVLGHIFFNIYTRELSSLIEKTFFAYADDSTLLAIISSAQTCFEVAISLIRDLVKLQA